MFGYLLFLTFTEHQVHYLYFVPFNITHTVHVEHHVTPTRQWGGDNSASQEKNVSKQY